MCKSASRSDLVLISFWALTTGSIFSNQTLKIQQRLQTLGFGGLFALKVLQMPGPPCTESAANSRIWGPPCTESAANSRIQGIACTKSAANSRIWGPHCTQGAANSRIWGCHCTENAVKLQISISQVLEFKGLFWQHFQRNPCLPLSWGQNVQICISF